jgi:GTPase Era involved in 16S rRNA processing
LLKIYDCRINLKLFVKVEKDWRNRENQNFN